MTLETVKRKLTLILPINVQEAIYEVAAVPSPVLASIMLISVLVMSVVLDEVVRAIFPKLNTFIVNLPFLRVFLKGGGADMIFASTYVMVTLLACVLLGVLAIFTKQFNTTVAVALAASVPCVMLSIWIDQGLEFTDPDTLALVRSTNAQSRPRRLFLHGSVAIVGVILLLCVMHLCPIKIPEDKVGYVLITSLCLMVAASVFTGLMLSV